MHTEELHLISTALIDAMEVDGIEKFRVDVDHACSKGFWRIYGEEGEPIDDEEAPTVYEALDLIDPELHARDVVDPDSVYQDQVNVGMLRELQEITFESLNNRSGMRMED